MPQLVAKNQVREIIIPLAGKTVPSVEETILGHIRRNEN